MDARLACRARSLAGVLVAFGSVGTALAEELTPFDRSLTSVGFEEIDREDGVTVYSDPDSELIRAAAETRLDVPPDVVLQSVLDYEGQRGVVKRVSRSQVLSRSPGRLLVYQRLNLPIVDDRDYTLEVTNGRDGDVLRVTFEVAAGRGLPELDGVVRVPHHSGSWQLKPLDGGRATLVRFQTCIDMGGMIPRWLVRSNTAKELPNLFRDLCLLIDRHRQGGGICQARPEP